MADRRDQRELTVLAPADIRDLALRKYPEFLRSIVDGSEFFPLPVRFGKPKSGAGFARLKSDIEALAIPGAGYRIEWREVRSRRLDVARQNFPDKVWFDSEAGYLRELGQVRDVARFREQLEQARRECPEIIAWVRQRPLAAVEHAAVWADLLQVCSWLKRNPRPGCYAREVPLPIGTKFIDDHQVVLREILPHVLPAAAVRPDKVDFAERFGFKGDEASVRMRILDASAVPSGWPSVVSDFAVPHSEFVRLDWPARRVLIVENKFTFLSLPRMEDVFAIWGAGGAVELLSGAEWLRRRELFYWGDLDVAGFHLLNRLRRAWGHVTSVMMDAEALAEFEDVAISSPSPSTDETDRLTEDEAAVCATLRKRKLRLEQEKLHHAWAVSRLAVVLARSCPAVVAPTKCRAPLG